MLLWINLTIANCLIDENNEKTNMVNNNYITE